MGLKQKSKKELIADIISLRDRIDALETQIRERFQAEKVFHNPMEVTRIMLDYANDAIYISQNEYFKFVNSKLVRITGFSPEELMATPSIHFIHPDDREVIRERYYRRFRGEAVPDLYPHRIVDKWGNVKWIEVSSVIITWEGRPAQLSFMRDITEKRVAEESLIQSEQLRTDIINFLPDATFAIDGQGRVTAWNHAIEELTGVSAQRMIGKGNFEYAFAFFGERKPVLIDKALKPSLPIEERYLSLNQEKDFLLAEAEMMHHGIRVILWCKAGIMRDRSGRVIGAIESLRDITSLKDMNTALNILLKKREYDIRESEEKLMINTKELVLPYIAKLKSSKLDLSQAMNIEIVEKHLNEIMSPFMTKFTSGYAQFSSRELQVASLIRDGMTTKEIAAVLNITTNAIDIYRQNIRKKLGLNREKTNLRSFLMTIGNN